MNWLFMLKIWNQPCIRLQCVSDPPVCVAGTRRCWPRDFWPPSLDCYPALRRGCCWCVELLIYSVRCSLLSAQAQLLSTKASVPLRRIYTLYLNVNHLYKLFRKPLISIIFFFIKTNYGFLTLQIKWILCELLIVVIKISGTNWEYL